MSHQTILEQLTQSRTHHIQAVINLNIIPIIESRATYGLSQTTIALLPSDIPLPPVEEKSEFSFDTEATSKAVEVIGFSSENEPKVVRLEGQMNRTEFWRPQVVIDMLERELMDQLNACPLLRSELRMGGVGRAEEVPERRMSRRTLLSRVMPSLGPEQRSPSGNPEVGVRQQNTVGRVMVKARLEELCLRTLSEFGLYDTMSKQCVIIRVDARC
jgi:hypothetical protein